MSLLYGFGAVPGGFPATAAPQTRSPIRRTVLAMLRADAGVTAVFGTRVFPLVVPEDQAFPALTYQMIHMGRERGLAGPTGINNASFQFAAHGRNLIDCEDGIEAVRQLFDGLATSSYGGGPEVEILGAMLDDERDLYTDPPDGSDRGVVMSSIDYTVRYREPRPRGG